MDMLLIIKLQIIKGLYSDIKLKFELVFKLLFKQIQTIYIL